MYKLGIAAALAAGVFTPVTHANEAPVPVTTQIDLLGVYTPGLKKHYNDEPVTAIQHRVNVANMVFEMSKVDVNVNLVGTMEAKYDEGERQISQTDALGAITPDTKGYTNKAFNKVEGKRKELGADMVTLFRNLNVNNSPDHRKKKITKGNKTYTSISTSCGRAHTLRKYEHDNAPALVKRKLYSHVYTNECKDDTLVHELGHNMGLYHAREQYSGKLPHTNGYSFPGAYGYGVEGQLATTMAYNHKFKVSKSTYTFSNPDIQCNGVPCGLKDVANAVKTLRYTAPLVAKVMTRPLPQPEVN
ncbi:zinc-dependent metalloprotease family protein [Vibrio nigripulchritudo]|uniref:zinc-dependent metalloprotease family protein n=1 Tax=Vibrio nigripulchritudo TaxID=28173 RepID=UPI000695D33F|nr:zinc-dependent metalloprotease family protein [Vibrio nigripulchritudo]